jgi:hypothetical protein
MTQERRQPINRNAPWGDGCVENRDGTRQPMLLGGTNTWPPRGSEGDRDNGGFDEEDEDDRR